MLTGRVIELRSPTGSGWVLLVPYGEVVSVASETVRLLAASSPFGVWMTKEVMWSNLETGIDLENRTQILTTFTDQQREPMVAWGGKRQPDFRYG